MERVRVLNCRPRGFYGQLTRGLSSYRREIAEKLGLEFVAGYYDSTEQLVAMLADTRESAVVVVPHFLTPPEPLAVCIRQLRSQGRRVFLLDGHDQTSSPHFVLLPEVDGYIKSKALRDRSDYQRDYLGGYVFSDFYARTYGFDLDGWQFGAKPLASQADRIESGWNFAVTPSVRYLARFSRLAPKPLAQRRYDLSLRLSPVAAPKYEWYQDYRRRCLQRCAGLRDRFRSTPSERTGRFGFYRELRDSRIVFSPFGWGEVCLRDYEAAALGALLVKPSCDHLATEPNIFVSGETYVAVRWDNADLDEKIERYLSDLSEAQRIVDNARDVLRSYFEGGGFMRTLRRTFRSLGNVR